MSLPKRIAWGAVAFALRGNQVECPCCGGRFRRFLAGGPERRPNARCPGCGSLERHRLVWLWLQRATDLFTAPHRVLVVAPERFLQEALRARPNLDYLSVDLASPLAMRRMDVTRLDLEDASFDVVLCNHVLEHVSDDRAAMRELRRVLRPNGWAVLQTPVDLARPVSDEDPGVTDPSERLHRFGQADHVRIYGRDFFERLGEAGWAVDRIAFARSLSNGQARRFGLDLEEELIVGRRA